MPHVPIWSSVISAWQIPFISRVAPPKNDRRCCDRHDGDHEWQDERIDVRVNQERSSGSRAEEQRDEHACKPPPLCNRRGPVSTQSRNVLFWNGNRADRRPPFPPFPIVENGARCQW